VEKGTAARILTGGVLPAGADAVVMQEDTIVRDGHLVVDRPVERGANVRRRGGEFRRGMKILPSGTVVSPAVIGLLAAMGRRHVRVFSRPRIAVLVTGDELRPVGRGLPRGGIYDSNSAALVSALRTLGLDAMRTERQKDDPAKLRSTLKRMLREADVVITTGGVSVGDRDYVKDVLGSLGVRTVFWAIAIRPGKPNYFGMYGQKLVFGLPGNPVSVLVSFLQLVRPALLKMMGSTRSEPCIVPARLGSSLKKKPGRLEFVRGTIANDRAGELIAFPLKGQDSHMLGAMANADCLLLFPAEKSEMTEGETVQVSLLRWSPL
jgi:molybdopterin molybdotransferase